MSQIARGLPKYGESKEGDGSDLSLSGSQVSLVIRPRSVTGRASIRALSVSGPRVRRPMSAIPTLSSSEMTRDKRRPYSADSQLLASSCHQKRSKHSTSFTMSREPIGLSTDFETDGDIEFSSSTLVSSNMSDQLGMTWMELEMKGLYLRNSDPAQHSCSIDDSSDGLCCSDASEEPTRSEKSLGQCIQAMARDHVQHDRLSFRHPTISHEKSNLGIETMSERESCNADPKKMSTKELHLQMVESGLIPSASRYTSVLESNVREVSQSKTNHHSHQDLSKDLIRAQIKDKETKNEFNLSGDFSKQETCSEIFWNQHDEFYQPINKTMSCIDQISFPKEHDVDSLEGDSSYSNNKHESQRNQQETSSASQVHSVQETIAWVKSDLIPVRFQQWVIDENSKDYNVTNTENLSTDYFLGMRLSHTQAHSEKANPDCTVEEISTDSEYTKTLSNYKERRINFESDSTPACSKSDLSALGGIPSKSGDMEKEKFKSDSISSTPMPLEQMKMEASSTHERLNSAVSISSPSVDLIKKTAPECEKVSRFERNFRNDFESSTVEEKNNSFSGLKNRSIVHETRRNQYQNKQEQFNRKMDDKQCGSFKKSGRNPPHNRTFALPKEESLPGESQTELLSWMAMCSENFVEENVTEGKQTLQHSPPSDSNDKDKDSPYNDIMTILRVLEEKEDESSLMRILNKKCLPEAQLDSTEQQINHTSSPDCNIDLAESSINLIQNEVSFSPASTHAVKESDSEEGKCSMDRPQEKQEANDCISKSTDAPCTIDVAVPSPAVEGELRDILTFLDAVDQSCSSVLLPNLTSNTGVSTAPLYSSEDSQSLEELLSMGRTELAKDIVSLRLALEDRDATINLLKTALREQKDNHAKQNAAHATELECHMRQVKAESEAIIKRHQKFIDQLISDKASLSERCESLIQDVRKCEEKHTKELSNLEAKHKVEMQRVKDITAATEKLKRERWVENKTQKIKELTVRGLEPELTRLTAQHEQEMSALRTLHAQELEQIETRAARRASQQMETLREQLIQEKEDALTREREILRQRMEKQQILYEEEGAEQRRRLVSEVRREQDRLATLEARLEAQFEERKRGVEREAEQERERVRRDYADKLTEMHRKQQNEILQLREALKAEKENWVETYQQQQRQTLTQTTNEIREQLKRERDREIEVVIERLENEATTSREEREKVSENRLRRVREQLTSELRDVESALNSLKEKHVELRTHLQEKEDKLVSSEALNRSLQTQLVETRKIADQLSAERADIKQALRSELHSEMKSLHQQLSEQHSRQQQQQKTLLEQLERERKSHQQELQQLYDRVKLAIAKKEEVVKVARSKQKAAEEQNVHLQALLDHRRKESLLS